MRLAPVLLALCLAPCCAALAQAKGSGPAGNGAVAGAPAPGDSQPGLALAGPGGRTLTLTPAQLDALPQTTVRVHNPHSGRDESYQGVALPLLLARLGAPLGSQLHGPALAMYLIAEGSDQYRALYSLAEVDPAMHPGTILVARRMDGHPLSPRSGPLQLVNTEDRRPARWVRNLVSLRLEAAPPPPGGQELQALSTPRSEPARR
jgi:hypothetical protein